MLAFIENFVRQNGYPPTREEIRSGLDISTKSLVNYHLEALEDAAFIKRIPNTPRGIRLTRENGRHKRLARKPVMRGLTKLDEGEILELTYGIVTDGHKLFALKAEGNMLADALVSDGDIVILQSQNYAHNGDLVAVRLRKSNKTVLKHYYRENGHVRLQPVKTNLKPLIVKPDLIEIQGKVVAVIRQFDEQARAN
jgi:repressor LexA